MPKGEPTAVVGKEGDRVVSLNVEETNRLRKEVGLKPLLIGDEASEEKYSKPVPKKPSAGQIAEEKESVRNKRARKRLLADSRGLADILAEEEGDTDAASWVSKHRKTVQKEDSIGEGQYTNDGSMGKRERAKAARKNKEKDTDMVLKICHDVGDLDKLEGDRVMTLRDVPLIGEDGELNDSTVDELEEQTLRDQQKREAAQKERMKIMRGIRGDHADGDADDAEYDSEGNLMKRDILERYDQWIDGGKKRVEKSGPKGFLIQQPENGEVIVDTATGASGAAKRFGEGRESQSLHTKLRFQSDVDLPLSTEDDGVFRRPTGKQRASHRKSFVDWAEVLGTKRNGVVNGKSEKKGERPNTEPDDINMSEGKLKLVNVRDEELEIDTEGGEHIEDRILYDQLSRSIKVARDRQLAASTIDSDATDDVKIEPKKCLSARADVAVLSALKSVVKKEEEGKDPLKGGLRLTSTTEFCRSVQTPIEKMETVKKEFYTGSALYRKQLLFKVNEGSKGVVVKEEKEEGADVGSYWLDKDDITEANGSRSRTDHSTNRTEAIDGGTDSEADEYADLRDKGLGSGVSGVLKQLQDRGELNPDVFRIGRRNKECRPMHTSTLVNDIKLECKDSYGRVMTQREAFRHISWIFHGKGPGKKKREAMLKKIQLERKLKKLNPVEESKTMKALEKCQQKYDQAHMTLSHV